MPRARVLLGGSWCSRTEMETLINSMKEILPKEHRFSLAEQRISSTCVHSNSKNGSAQGLLAETAAIRSTVSNHVAVDAQGLQLCEMSLSSEIGGDLRYYEHEALIFFPAQTSVLNVGILGHAEMDPQKS